MDIAQKTVKVAENVPASCAVVRNALATAQGERIEVNDVANVEHDMVVKLTRRQGKNLFNINCEQSEPTPNNISTDSTIKRKFVPGTYVIGMTRNNSYDPTRVTAYSFTDNGLTITVSTGYWGIVFPFKLQPNTEYTFSCKVDDKTKISLSYSFYDDDGAIVNHFGTWQDPKCTFTTDEYGNVLLGLIVTANNSTATFSDIQLELGNTATEYEPYIPYVEDFSEVTVTRCGRNLLNGADLVPHINANGQPLESVVFNGRQCLKTIVGKENMIDSYGRYTFDVPLTYFSAEVYSQSRTASVFTMYKKSGKFLYANPSRDLSNWRIDVEATDDDPFVSMSMYVYGTNDSETVYIDTNGFYGSIVADNQEKTPYVQPQTYTPGEDGTVRGIKSLSPTTILTTDTAGASIKCKYFPTGQERVAQIHQAITDELEHLKSITAKE